MGWLEGHKSSSGVRRNIRREGEKEKGGITRKFIEEGRGREIFLKGKSNREVGREGGRSLTIGEPRPRFYPGPNIISRWPNKT